ncbi:hypothetical protein A3B18_01275 [Candidatus Giovannonibacteria bacterium RIFCSPLOWO2_01_FULL_46_13]|uniref:Uncharacterized protein n=1 Tax=Candidatus Giovannonibacteria bacterium RIFCSPLOWO2_01_FULL_46_13 TaxID=1798352 RepID=A0A1F5X3X3_9BACT|nr:MAG: hypothetical protein A3B18_01275 [Candidatus Giovannonibacteria bacterium RIFCSPLOWO2_01_FULL_46_13]
MVQNQKADLMHSIIKEAGGTIAHKFHEERCNCEERRAAYMEVVAILAAEFDDITLARLGFSDEVINLHWVGDLPSSKKTGALLRTALLPQSLDMFLQMHPGLDIEPLHRLAYVGGAGKMFPD